MCRLVILEWLAPVMVAIFISVGSRLGRRASQGKGYDTNNITRGIGGKAMRTFVPIAGK